MSDKLQYPSYTDNVKLMREPDIEHAFIAKLQDLKYVYRQDIRDRASLEGNFRQKFETLNQVHLTDAEFQRLLDEIVTADVFSASRILRERNDFLRDDGTPLSFTLVNIKDWCKNDFEVVTQLRLNTNNSHHRYDVLLLINGVPVVQIELKTLSVNHRRAMEQIVEYKNDPGNGYTRTLLCFIQLFVVSNRTDTVYFANNNARHFAFDAEERFLPVYRFADRDNKPISYLDDFADRVLQKCELGRMVSRYMVLIQSEQKLLMMRPYQIYAVQAIVECIEQNSGNGYIWHTTGSGKTLTSFKASTLLKESDSIEKCLFVVDRKDLDKQTREEFNRFQEGCVEENTNTATLVDRLLSDDRADKVIVTTIQKLGLALDGTNKRNYRERLASLSDKRVVFIFDECHRSQFGENHRAIKEFFPNSQLFGFTGTPIFEENASRAQIEAGMGSMRTTVDLFQQELHAYTITHAIEDRNVLRFHVDYYKPDTKSVTDVASILTKRAIVEAILERHNAATFQRRFNALLATSSINDAIEFYKLFGEIQDEKRADSPDYAPLKIACVFSPPAEGDPDVKQIQEDLPQERADNMQDPEGKKAALRSIVDDYNHHYSTNHSVAEFDLYYQDVQKRIKDQKYSNADLPLSGDEKVDITIVVDMLLTGFDSPYLNTLYVDKNLKHHGLIQAFSRTNRVLNTTKPHGQIIDFRQQQESVDAAVVLFSGVENEAKARKIWLADPASDVIQRLREAKTTLDTFMVSQGLAPRPESVPAIRGDDARATFIQHFREIQRLTTQLDQYTDLTAENRIDIEGFAPRNELNAYRGVYLQTAQELKERQGRINASKPDPVVDNLEFEFVLFSSAVIDYDYIMKLIADFSTADPGSRTMSREQIINLIQADAKFIDERDAITEYVRTLKAGEGLDESAIRDGYRSFKKERLAIELASVAQKHAVATDSLEKFVDATMQRMVFDGEQLTELVEPLGLAWRDRRVKELALMVDLMPVLKKRAAGREISGLSAYDS